MIHRTSYFKRNKEKQETHTSKYKSFIRLIFSFFLMVLILTLFKYMQFIFYRTQTNLDFYLTYGKCYLLHIFIDFVIFSVCSQLENDVIGIIGVCEKCALATIQSYSDTFQVPFLLISSAPIPDDVTSDSFQFFLTPVFIQGLLDIVIYKQWHRVFYIYDTDEGLAKLYEFYLFFTNVFVNFIGLQKLF